MYSLPYFTYLSFFLYPWLCVSIHHQQIPQFPLELKPSEKRPTSSFKTSGRASAFIENSTMFYKSLRDEVALTNLGPGSYNLAYTWRTDEHNYAHLRYVYYLFNKYLCSV